MTDLATAVQLHNWYAVVALALTLFTQLVRKKNVPLFTWAWKKTPDGFRFLYPLFAGAVTGFTDGFFSGMSMKMALLQAAAACLSIGPTSMGIAAALKESHLPWDGFAGGKYFQRIAPVELTVTEPPNRNE
jgi:uncharacterized membrane protein YfcA